MPGTGCPSERGAAGCHGGLLSLLRMHSVDDLPSMFVERHSYIYENVLVFVQAFSAVELFWLALMESIWTMVC